MRQKKKLKVSIFDIEERKKKPVVVAAGRHVVEGDLEGILYDGPYSDVVVLTSYVELDVKMAL